MSGVSGRWMRVAAAVLPFIPFLVAVVAYAPPSSSEVSPLVGTWERVRSLPTTPQDVTDFSTGQVRLPGVVGPVADFTVLARVVEIPPHVAGQACLLVAGGMSQGIVDVYVNGRFLGSEGLPARGYKLEHVGLLGFDVPQGGLLAGPNVVAFLLHKEGVSGVARISVQDARLLLGPRDVLLPFLHRAQIMQRLLELGSIFYLAFASALILLLASLEKERVERLRFLSAAGLGLAVALYLAGKCGLAQVFGVPHGIIPYAITAIGALVPEFLQRQMRGHTNRLQKVNVAICTAQALFQLLFPSDSSYRLFVPYLFVIIVYSVGWSTWHLVRGTPGASLLLLSTALAMAVAGLNDLMTDVGLLATPRLFTLAAADFGVLASLVIVARLLRTLRENTALVGDLGRKNQELGVALERAEEATRLKSSFLANTSHELRTPLNSIINVPEGLLEEFSQRTFAVCGACSCVFDTPDAWQPDPNAKCPECRAVGTLNAETRWAFDGDPGAAVRYLKSIQQSGRHLLLVVNDVLDFSKLEAGRMELHVETTRVADVLEKLSLAMMPLAQSKRLALTMDLDNPDAEMETDPLKLTQVLMNLVSNAIKFTPDDGKVDIRARAANGRVTFDVVDTGIGIEEKDLQRVFESFLQLDSGHTRKYSGTGLGLAISKKLVDLMDGTLRVKSTPGVGSTFSVDVPRQRAAAQR
jgi:signal transduction histidine kinase